MSLSAAAPWSDSWFVSAPSSDYPDQLIPFTWPDRSILAPSVRTLIHVRIVARRVHPKRIAMRGCHFPRCTIELRGIPVAGLIRSHRCGRACGTIESDSAMMAMFVKPSYSFHSCPLSYHTSHARPSQDKPTERLGKQPSTKPYLPPRAPALIPPFPILIQPSRARTASEVFLWCCAG